MSHISTDNQHSLSGPTTGPSVPSATEWKQLASWDLSSAATARRALLAALDRLPEANLDDPAASAVNSLVWDMVDEAECHILDQPPNSYRDAVAIIDVLLEGEPCRSDRRDHDALKRMRDLLNATPA